MRDCCAISLGNKKWLHAVRAALYEDIHLVGPDSAQQRKKYKLIYTTRLVLLRRSLRADPKLGEMVRSLKVPALPEDAPLDTATYHDIVASVVKACPNLERLDGFYPSYTLDDSRLFSALCSREKLKEMHWVIDAMAPDTAPHGHKSQSSKSRNRASTADSFSKLHSNPFSYLTPQLANKFVRHHMNWNDLAHLTIHCLPGANLRTPHGLINIVLTYLPSLQSLYLSHVPSESFDDQHLLELPCSLRKLSISHCPGVTTAGLSTFATHSAAQDIETLTLIHQNLDSLPAIVRIFSNLSRLTTFNLVQSLAPAMPADSFAIWLMPYLASHSLQNLHWDIFESENYGVTKADDILARSIAANGFPNLRTLRTPCDPDGLFQALCKPRERVDLPGDRVRNRGSSAANQINPVSRTNTGVKTNGGHKPSPSSNSFSVGGSDFVVSTEYPIERRLSSDTNSKDSGKCVSNRTREAGSDLHAARRAAQARLEAARQFPRIEANVTDENGILIESTGLAGFIGTVGSKIAYSLVPDVGGTDDKGGLVGICDLLSDGGEDLYASGCRGANEAGYGTGCTSACMQAKEHEVRAALESNVKGNRLSKSNGSGKNANRDKDEGEDGARRKVRDGCTGRWRTYNYDPFAPEKKMAPETWQHTERGRWRGRVELS